MEVGQLQGIPLGFVRIALDVDEGLGDDRGLVVAAVVIERPVDGLEDLPLDQLGGIDRAVDRAAVEQLVYSSTEVAGESEEEPPV